MQHQGACLEDVREMLQKSGSKGFISHKQVSPIEVEYEIVVARWDREEGIMEKVGSLV